MWAKGGNREQSESPAVIHVRAAAHRTVVFPFREDTLLSPIRNSLCPVKSRAGASSCCNSPGLSSPALSTFDVNSRAVILTELFFLRWFYFTWESLGTYSFVNSQGPAQSLGHSRQVWRAGHTLQSYLVETPTPMHTVSWRSRRELFQVLPLPCWLVWLNNCAF